MFYVFNIKKIQKFIFRFIVVLILFTSIYTVLKIYLPLEYVDIINEKSSKYDLKPEFVCAMIRTESRFRVDVVSRKGASGLMQIMEPTAVWAADQIGFDDFDYNHIFDAGVNIEIGCWYISKLANQYSDFDVALAAYNAGSGNVDNWLKDKRYSKDGKTLYYIPFNETRNYIDKINRYQKFYKLMLLLDGGPNEK